MSVGMKDVAKAYYEEHGYYLEGPPLPLFGDYNVATVTADGEVIVTEVTGEATKTLRELGEIPKALDDATNKLFVGMTIILILVIVAGIVT